MFYIIKTYSTSKINTSTDIVGTNLPTEGRCLPSRMATLPAIHYITVTLSADRNHLCFLALQKLF